jgi:hypothetical protein
VVYEANQMAGGHRFIDDLLQYVVGDEDELKQVIRNEDN